MAQDATAATTAKGIPKYNTAADPPSGKGFNAAMDQIDLILSDYAQKPSGTSTGECMVWNGTAWARSSVTRLNTVRPQDLVQDGATTGQVMVWDGAKWAPGSASNYDASWSSDTPVTVSNTAAETLLADLTVTAATHYTDKSRIKLMIWGDWLHNNATGDTVTLQVRSGTTSTATEGVVLGNTNHSNANQAVATRGIWVADIDIMFGASYEAYAMGNHASRLTGSSANISSNNYLGGAPGASSPPVNAGSTDTHLKFTVTWSAASANNQYKMFGYRAWWIKG